jgi:manganese/zinc/iron transport system substrate-binding protein
MLLLHACKTKHSSGNDTGLQIVTTTGMIADGVKNITGDIANVVSLMGPGVDPHLYKATQGDLAVLRNADIIIHNGLHLEGKMQEIFEELAKTKTVLAIADGVDTAQLRNIADVAGKVTHDPHLWFDVQLWSQGLSYTSEKIAAFDKEHAAIYKSNTEAYLDTLQQLDAYVRETMQKIPAQNRILITSHDAFGYFGRAYGIEVRGLQGISTAAEFGLKDITDIVDMIVKQKILAVFVESSVSEKSISAVVEGCKQKGHAISIGGTLFSDAMGAAGTPEGTYIGMVTHNANTIADALQ